MTSENEHESMTESEADRDRDRDRDQENRIPTDKPVDAGSHNHDHDQERGDSDSDSDSGSDGDSGETVKSKVRGDVDRASGGEFMPKYNDDDVLELLASNAPEPLSDTGLPIPASIHSASLFTDASRCRFASPIRRSTISR